VVPGEGTWTVEPATGAITFTPEAGFTGDPTPIDYTVKDDEGTESDPATVGVEYPQVVEASDDNGTGETGNPVTVPTIGNDSGDNPLDPTTVDLDPTSVPAATGTDTDNDGDIDEVVVPGEGTWTVDPATGAITFTPEAGFTGDPTPIAYTVKDDEGTESDPATVVIDYEQVLHDDSKSGKVGEPVSFNIINNDDELNVSSVSFIVPTDATGDDTDGDGDIDKVTVPGEGIWTVDETGLLTFTPENGFENSPTPIDYIANDSNGNPLDPATVTILYIDAAVIPVANDDTLKVNHYGSNAGSVVDNDVAGVGPIAEHTYQLVDANGNLVPAGTTIPTEHGSVVMEEDGSYIYTPEANYNGPDIFNYVIIDKAGQQDSAKVDVNVDCASTQTSDGGDTLGTIGMLMMIFITIMTGLYFTRREEITRKKREEA